MKKGPLHFLGRKNQSLFDTNIKMKDMDNAELVLVSSAIPESGTASVRARPTVKHHSSSSDSFQGFAVPTPKVPLLPPVNGPKINGSFSDDQLSNGSVVSVPDLVEGEIFVPPPPSVAPPPPPGTFVLPPPDFMGDLNSPELVNLQSPPMPAPKSTSLASMEDGDLSFLQPPPMAPPKIPSTGPASSIPIYSVPSATVPQHPSYAPPQLPTDRQQKMLKTPPPKPIRLSSVSSFDTPPQTPAPPPPVQTPTLSTFNSQKTAKIYDVPKSSVLSRYQNRDTKPKQKLLLEDSVYVNPLPAHVQVDGKGPKVVPTSTPASKDVQELKENSNIPQPSKTLLPELKKEAKTGPVDITKLLQSSPQKSPQPLKVNSTPSSLEPSMGKPDGSPSQSLKFSPLLDRKLRNLKGSETNGARETHAASPLALLMAAKEREKHRSVNSPSQENSAKNDWPSASIQPSEVSPNSFVVTPRSRSSSTLTSTEERQEEGSKSALPVEHTQKIQMPVKSDSPVMMKDQISSSDPLLSRIKAAAEQSPSKSQSAQHEDNKEELNIPFLPPPPEFGDFDEFMDPPPSMLPPDPPAKKAPTPTVSPLLIPPVPPPPPPPPPAKAVPPPPPKLPSPKFDVKPKPQVQTTHKLAPTQLPATLSPSQVTLLSILQKKMLEMDHKMAPVTEAESNSDDWSTPLSDEDNKVPVVLRTKPQTKNDPTVIKAPTLDMRELENKMVRKPLETSSVKLPATSNGPQSKHQYGMTFTVRPGTKNPITLVRKGDS